MFERITRQRLQAFLCLFRSSLSEGIWQSPPFARDIPIAVSAAATSIPTVFVLSQLRRRQRSVFMLYLMRNDARQNKFLGFKRRSDGTFHSTCSFGECVFFFLPAS
jgi:hypothetical protein